MIDNNKIYTKEEFKELLKLYLYNVIQSYERHDGGLFEYYVSDSYPLTDEQEASHKYGRMSILKCEDIPYLYNRSKRFIYEDPVITKEFLSELKRHNIKDDPQSFYDGYIQGVNNAIAYLSNFIGYLEDNYGKFATKENLFKGKLLQFK